jgi:hypothetical protein
MLIPNIVVSQLSNNNPIVYVNRKDCCSDLKVASVGIIFRLRPVMLIPAQAAHHNEMMSPAVTE